MFETALIESQKRKAPKNKWLIINTALILHVVFIAGVLAAQYWQIDERLSTLREMVRQR